MRLAQSVQIAPSLRELIYDTMSAALATILVIVVILVGVYAMTRDVAPPAPPRGPCKVDRDCPHPAVCVAGGCVDPQLGGLIAATQSDAKALFDALTSVKLSMSSTYYQHAVSLQTAAVTMGLTEPDLGATQADMTAAIAGLDKYITFLVVPKCDRASTSSCGYYSDMMALTPSSASGAIISATQPAAGMVDMLPVATDALKPVSDDLANLVSAVVASGKAKIKKLSADVNAKIAIVNADIATILAAPATFTAAATRVKHSGFALYNHFI